MNNLLAIVIPAYKVNHLSEALESIANQTNKKFTLYIGDDASPNDLYNVIKGFEDRLTIVYKRFDINFGGQDLIAHWERCIDMIKDEEWIWLFSDDDMMDKECVEKFYEFIKSGLMTNILRFNTLVINTSGEIIKHNTKFPFKLSIQDFYYKRMNFEINSYAVEYIFRKEIYLKESGFTNFDLGWCSDDSTWLKFGKDHGIITLSEPMVRWRYSKSNISAELNNKQILTRKILSNIKYIQWVNLYFSKNKLVDDVHSFKKLKWIMSAIVLSKTLSLKSKYDLLSDVIHALNYKNIKFLGFLYLIYWHLRRK